MEPVNFCVHCGRKLKEGENVCPGCNNEVYKGSDSSTSENETVKPAKKKFSIKSIIISVLIIAVSRFVGGFVGSNMAEEMIENKHEKEIETYNESIEQYVPGSLDGKTYSNKTFGFKFTYGEDWELVSDDDLSAYSQQTQKNGLASAKENMEKEGVPDSLKDKWTEGAYIAVETGGAYVSDGMYAGDMYIMVMGMYGAEFTTADQYIDGIIAKLGSSLTFKKSDEFLAGDLYKSVSYMLNVDGMDIENKTYIALKDDMVCMITCRALKGYEDRVWEAFENSIEKY